MDRLTHNNSDLTAPDCPIGSAALLYVDLETTGLHPERGAEITEVAVLDSGGLRVDWRVDDGSGSLGTHLPELTDALAAGVVIGHNVGFDFEFLAYEIARRNRRGFTTRFIDTLALARRLDPTLGDHRLESLVDHLDFEPEEALHTAAVDVRVTEKLFWHLVETGDLETLADAGLSKLDWTAV